MVKILFLHPDLGIGGAERLVVDAALALKKGGHEVTLLTNHHDPTHCFPETIDGSFMVQVTGDWLPRDIFGRFLAFCAYLRMLYAALFARFFLLRREKIDVIFCDQISIGILLFCFMKNRPKIIFYCHFPDQLLSAKEGYLKSMYRSPLNYLEEYTIGKADTVLVNSKFTLRIFKETFRRLNFIPEILYPSLNTDYFDEMQWKMELLRGSICLPAGLPKNVFLFLDINRYERKKNHKLALYSFKEVLSQLQPDERQRIRLVIAGGYDTRVSENVGHFNELKGIAKELDLEKYTIFLQSPSNNEKLLLLNESNCLLYTPKNEHFGIVPLEAMYMKKPVIALNSGGPTETIVDNITGLLCSNDSLSFANSMLRLYRNAAMRDRMGNMGRKRVQLKFSFKAFATKLNKVVEEVLKGIAQNNVN